MSVETSTSPYGEEPGGITKLSYGAEPSIQPQRGFLGWWYHIAAPTEPEHSTFQDRERVRAGQLSSIILLLILCFGFSQLPNALVSMNHSFLGILLIAMFVNIVVFFLNRQGMVLIAGTIMVVVVEAAFILVVLTSPLGLSSRSLTIFHLIILTELMAVSLLPPKSVFLALFCNAVFTWAAITFMHHAADFPVPTPSSYYAALASPLVLQGIVALVTYLWVQGARRAIAQAEHTAMLERALAEKDRAAAEQKQQLEEGIQHILQTHIQVANGNFEARAPLSKDNVLWQVANALNNLLARLQRNVLAEQELQRVKAAAYHLTEVVHLAKRRNQIIRTAKSGTILDPLAQELSDTSIHQK